MGGGAHPNERRAAVKANHVGNLEGAVRRRPGGKEKERKTDRVQSDIRAFGIAGDWQTTAFKAEM